MPNTGDEPFRHYSWKHRVAAWVSQNLFDEFTYTCRHGLLSGMKRKGGLGWMPVSTSADSSPETQFMRSIDLKGKVVYDVGSFVGLMAMHFARQAKHVVAYEPTQRNRKRLMENLALNGIQNVTVRPVAAGERVEDLEMVIDPLMPGGASLAQGVGGSEHERIHLTTLDRDRAENNLPPPDFIKVDTEGFELQVLMGARETLIRHRPELYLEMHGQTMNEKRHNVAAIVSFLESIDCRNIVHIESATKLTDANTGLAAQGHLYCRFGAAKALDASAGA
jgi:FkbM family methyltransferase